MAKRANGNQLPKGVEYHGNGLRIWFMWRKKRWREALPFTPTKANIAAAARTRTEVVSLIKLGAFDEDTYIKYFPETTNFEINQQLVLFSHAAQQYLDQLNPEEVSEATREEYKKVLNRYWIPELWNRELKSITYRELRQLVQKHEWKSIKTRNNALTPLRGVFKFAEEDELIDKNPATKLKTLRKQKMPPDPFTAEETGQILTYMHEEFSGWDRIYTYYFELAFNTGMRTSELLALTWDDIDFRQSYVRVAKAKVRSKVQNRTKTKQYREVTLNSAAMRAIRALRLLTGTDRSGMLFLAPQTKEPIASYQAPLKVWRKTLRKLGIRYRKPYNTRHTYASMALMENLPVGLIAKQLGHSITTLTTTYAKWTTSSTDKNLLDQLSLPSPLNKTAH